MKIKKFFSKYDEVVRRNSLLSFCIVILSTGFIISSFFSYKAIKNQKIVLITPNLSNDLRLETKGNDLNFEFLKLYSEYITSLLLNYSPSSYERKINDFLFLCTPEYESFAKKKLYENLKNIRKTGVNSIYHLTDKIKIDKETQEIFIFGKRSLIVSGKIVESKKENYIVKYKIVNRRFYINGFQKNIQ